MCLLLGTNLGCDGIPRCDAGLSEFSMILARAASRTRQPLSINALSSVEDCESSCEYHSVIQKERRKGDAIDQIRVVFVLGP